ncbi:hypothetical protein MWU59_11850 [Flavobacteriaceae bacterium F08102]|nr:hypothetical protein [Flavobacteriaceae bacterium F08102]
MKKSMLTTVMLLCTIAMNSQTKKELDRAAILQMAGCFEVSFNFAETFSYSTDENYRPSEVKHDKGLEVVKVLVDEEDKIVLQHLLIVGPPNAQQVIKHWRQDWLYENTDFYIYEGDNKWSYKSLPKEEVRGQWTQKVYQIDDSPRYEGSATWVHVDGKSRWENTTPAPLARREYTQRNDYNILLRTNKHEITEDGWIHDQDNDKVVRKLGQKDLVLAREKGTNIYTRVADEKGKAAHEYWEKNSEKWAVVRAKWEEVFRRHVDLNLAEKVDNKPLFKYLPTDIQNTSNEAVSTIIESFLR